MAHAKYPPKDCGVFGLLVRYKIVRNPLVFMIISLSV